MQFTRSHRNVNEFPFQNFEAQKSFVNYFYSWWPLSLLFVYLMKRLRMTFFGVLRNHRVHLRKFKYFISYFCSSLFTVRKHIKQNRERNIQMSGVFSTMGAWAPAVLGHFTIVGKNLQVLGINLTNVWFKKTDTHLLV